MIAIISLATSSFAQTESPTLPTEKEPIQVVESIEQVDDTIGDEVSIQMDEEAIQVLDESIQNITKILHTALEIDAEKIICIFCARPQNKVNILVGGPMVHICNHCLDICNEVVNELG